MERRRYLCLIAIFGIVCLVQWMTLWAYKSWLRTSTEGGRTPTGFSSTIMSTPITHIVSFRYKDPSVADEVFQRFVALKNECKLDAGKGQAYILSLTGGSDISPEGRAKGLHQTFVLVFPDIPSRDYYLDHDPAHQAFKEFVFPKIEDAFVFDYADGKYALQ